MQKVMHNDRKLARIVGYDRRGRPEGHVVEVTDRANKRVIGRLLNENGVWVVAPEDKRIGQDILLAGSQGKAKAGQVVSVELTDFPRRPSRYQPVGRVVRSPRATSTIPAWKSKSRCANTACRMNSARPRSTKPRRLPDEVRPVDARHRIDLRDVPLVTIDGEDARDFDDAVYCEPVQVGRGEGFRLIVAIADVSHYVHPKSGLDARRAGAQHIRIFPRRVIPCCRKHSPTGSVH